MGNSLLVSGEVVRNPFRAVAKKIYTKGMAHDMPQWLVKFTGIAHLGYDMVLGVMTHSGYPIIKYASAKSLSATGHAVNSETTCLKCEFSPEELANLLFYTAVGITDRRALHSLSVHPRPAEKKRQIIRT